MLGVTRDTFFFFRSTADLLSEILVHYNCLTSHGPRQASKHEELSPDRMHHEEAGPELEFLADREHRTPAGLVRDRPAGFDMQGIPNGIRPGHAGLHQVLGVLPDPFLIQ
jgi:hypothetical protein